MNNQRAPPLNAQIDRAVRSTVYALKMPIFGHSGWESDVPEDIRRGMVLSFGSMAPHGHGSGYYDDFTWARRTRITDEKII